MTGQRSGATTLRTRGLVLAAGFALLGGITACSPESIAERVVEAGSDGEVDIDINDEGGQVTIDSPDGGTATFGGSELPDDFPADIPVADGTINFTQSMTDPESGVSYTVLVTVAGEPADIWDEIKADLEAAGFTSGDETTITSAGDSYFSGIFTSADWEVAANVSGSGGESNVAYVVTAPG